MATTSSCNENDIKLEQDTINLLCRCCLTTGQRMIKCVYFEAYIRDLTGLNVLNSDGLPQQMCIQCYTILEKSVKFKYKMLRAHTLLYEYSTRCAPFPMDAQDPELSKNATPHLTSTPILSFDSAKSVLGYHTVLQHEKVPPSILQNTIPVSIPISDRQTDWSEGVKEEAGFSDYDDNITLEEFRSVANKITEDDLATLLQDTEDNLLEVRTEKKKKKKKEDKTKKRKKTKEKIGSTEEIENRSSIRKAVDVDPNKIRVIMLNPEEQIKQREEESKKNLKFPFQCKMCYKGFNFESKLENHLAKHSPSRGRFECKLCHMYLPTSYSFTVHSLIHTRRFECVECGRRMIDRNSILDHYRSQHEGVSSFYTCQFCGKISTNSKTHRSHIRNHHSGERPSCELCGKTFVNKDSLKEHQQIHEGIKNYECGVCNKRFRTRYQMKYHQTKHSDVKDFYCVECDVRFKSAVSLKKHLQNSLKHKDIECLKFACACCTRRYASARQLAAHVAVQHEGARPHVCPCGAALASRASLHKHRARVHGDKPRPTHVCHSCGKPFASRSTLVNHIRTHTGEKPFPCSHCGRKFSQRTSMRTHVKLVHLKIKTKNKGESPQSAVAGQELFKPEAPVPDWRHCDMYVQVSARP